MRKVTKGAVTMKLWDVGGQKRFRTMWERYCRGVQAIVYVVDAADHDTLDESSALLLELMQRPSVQGIPLLVLGNKNDVPNALNSEDLRDRMRLQVRLLEITLLPVGFSPRRNIDQVTPKTIYFHYFKKEPFLDQCIQKNI